MWAAYSWSRSPSRLISTLRRAPRSPARSSSRADADVARGAGVAKLAHRVGFRQRRPAQAHRLERRIGRQLQRFLDPRRACLLVLVALLGQPVGADDGEVGVAVLVDERLQPSRIVRARLPASRSRSSPTSVAVRGFGSPATIASSAAPSAPASAAAEPPPGVGVGDAERRQHRRQCRFGSFISVRRSLAPLAAYRRQFLPA